MSDLYKRFSESVTFRMRMDKPPEIMNLTWALGLVGETGEVVDLIKKHIGHSHPLDRAKLVKELGDVEWYMEAIRQACKLTRDNGIPAYVVLSKFPEVDECREALYLATEVGKLVFYFAEPLKPYPQTLEKRLYGIDANLASVYHRFGITREEALEANIAKLTERYPNGFNTADSINRRDVKP